jgi:hypothetical protein
LREIQKRAIKLYLLRKLLIKSSFLSFFLTTTPYSSFPTDLVVEINLVDTYYSTLTNVAFCRQESLPIVYLGMLMWANPNPNRIST